MTYRVAKLVGQEIYQVQYWKKPWFRQPRWVVAKVPFFSYAGMSWERAEYSTKKDACQTMATFKAQEAEADARYLDLWEGVCCKDG